MKVTRAWCVAIMAAACFAFTAGIAKGEIEMNGALALNNSPVVNQGMLLLSLGGLNYITTDSTGEFSINDVEEGLFILSSLLNVSGPSVLDGSLFMDGRPGLFTIVFLLQSGQPRIAFIDFQGGFTVANLSGTTAPMIILGFAR